MMVAPARAQATPSAMIASMVSGMPGCRARLQAPFSAASIQTLRIAASPFAFQSALPAARATIRRR